MKRVIFVQQQANEDGFQEVIDKVLRGLGLPRGAEITGISLAAVVVSFDGVPKVLHSALISVMSPPL